MATKSYKEQLVDFQALAVLQKKLLGHLPQLKGRVLVIGDVGLDEYVVGDVRRISPEAPVPVVEVQSEMTRLGLAANVAQNVVSLGGHAEILSVIGEDQAATKLCELIETSNLSARHLIVDSSRPTIRKLRVMTENHHIVRVDYEKKNPISADLTAQLLKKVDQILPTVDAVIIEDYAKGCLHEESLQAIIAKSHKAGKKVLIDPYRSTPLRYYRGADVVTPNRDEAVQLSGLNPEEFTAHRNSEEFLLEVGSALQKQGEIPHVVLTRGKEGMSLFENGVVTHMPTYARKVFDVTGAGDTVIAAMALGLASGLSLVDSCVLSNFAAGVVVGKVGSVPCELNELKEYIETHQ